MNCNIYVINLKSSTERRENIERQFKKIGTDFLLFNAINGNENHHPLFNRYNEKKRKLLRGNPLNSGQLGCFASHYLLWEKCVSLNQAIIIIEDDAIIDPKLFLNFYNNTRFLSPDYQCIRLFKNKRKNYRYLLIKNDHEKLIGKFTKGHMSTTGYYLTPEGAKKFLESANEWLLPVDLHMDNFWSNKVECYGLITPCLDNDKEFDSDIGYAKNKNRRPIHVKARRELFTLSQLIRRTIWNTLFKLKNLSGN